MRNLILLLTTVLSVAAIAGEKPKFIPNPTALTLEAIQAELAELTAMEDRLDQELQGEMKHERLIELRELLPNVVAGDQEALAILEQASDRMGNFQSLYDDYSIRSVSLVMDLGYLALTESLKEIRNTINLTWWNRAKFEGIVFDLKTEYQNYLDNKNLDTPWADPKAKFNSACKKFFKGLEHFDLFLKKHGTSEFKETARRSELKSVSNWRKNLAYLNALPIVKQLIFPQKPKGEKEGELALSKAAVKATKGTAKTLGFDVTVEHGERLGAALSDRKVVTLITPNHTHAYADLMAMSELLQEDTVIVTALNAVMDNKHFLRRAFGNPQVVGVGSSHIKKSETDADPIEKAISILERGTSNSVIIYPQGNLNAGLLEVRPTSKKFGREFVTRLIEAGKRDGYRVQILPVVYDNSGTPLLDDFRMLAKKEGRVLNVEVLNPITPDEVEFLLEYDPTGTIFNHVLRQHWLSNLKTDKDNIVGQLRLDSALGQLDFLAPIVTSNSGLNQCSGVISFN